MNSTCVPHAELSISGRDFSDATSNKSTSHHLELQGRQRASVEKIICERPLSIITIISAYDNVRTPDNFRSILQCVRSINACPVTMSERKRTDEAEPEGSRIAKKRKVTVKTMQKWVKENDKALDTATWLTFDKLNQEDAATLKCSVCIKFEKKTAKHQKLQCSVHRWLHEPPNFLVRGSRSHRYA